jgi:hypothetical protein
MAFGVVAWWVRKRDDLHAAWKAALDQALPARPAERDEPDDPGDEPDDPGDEPAERDEHEKQEGTSGAA